MPRLIEPALREIDIRLLMHLREIGLAVPFGVTVFERFETGAGVVAVAADVGVLVGAVGQAAGFAFEGAPGGDEGVEDGAAGGDVLWGWGCGVSEREVEEKGQAKGEKN